MGNVHLLSDKRKTYIECRTYFQQEDRTRLAAGIAVWSITYAFLIISDYIVFGSGAQFLSILLLRLLYLIFSAVILFRLKIHTSRWQELDRLALYWGLVSVLLTFVVYQFRQPIQANVFLFDLVGCMSFFIFITNRLCLQVIPAAIYTFFDLFLVLSFRDLFQGAMVRTVFFTFLGCFLVACFFSIQFFRARHKLFLAHIKDASVRADLRRLASTDSLTGVFNRRRLLEIAADAYYRFKRYERPFSIILMDLDGFKRINDTFGHQQGDSTLVEFAKIVGVEKRESDALGRMGGDEFCLVLPETSTQAAIHLAERILPSCQAIGNGESGAFLMGVTVSIGISQVTSMDASLDSLFARADAALYQAKFSGRNCWRMQ